VKTGADIETLDIPASLLAEIRADAEKEQRPAAEVLRDVIERGLEEHRWQRVLAYGAERAKALGLTEADVPRLIAESRAEQRNGRPCSGSRWRNSWLSFQPLKQARPRPTPSALTGDNWNCRSTTIKTAG